MLSQSMDSYLKKQKIPPYLLKYEPQYTQIKFAADGGAERCEVNHKLPCKNCGVCKN
jgi:hypothetical protein